MPQPTTPGETGTTADKIRTAAAALFIERSYADVTIDQVADAARVTKGAVYHHFTSKERLYLDTLLRGLDSMRQLHERAADSAGSCRDRLRALTADFFAQPDHERKLAQLVRRDANIFDEAARGELVAAYQAAIPGPIERIVRDGVRDGEVIPGDPRLLAWQFVAMVEVVLTDYAAGRFARDDDRLNYVLSLFFRGCEWPTRGGNE